MYRLLSTHHHPHSQHFVLRIAPPVPTQPRFLHQLIRAATLQRLTRHHRTMVHLQLHLAVLLPTDAPRPHHSDHIRGALHSSSHASLWTLSALVEALDGHRTTAILVHLCLCQNHTLGHHRQPCPIRHLHDHSWKRARPCPRSRQILCRS